MMRKLFSLLTVLLCLACRSAAAEGKTYTNPETGYRAVLQDDIDLLTEAEEEALAESMKKLTAHTNAVFWTTREGRSQSEARKNAEKKHTSLIGYHVNGVLMMIDMNARYMFLDTEGWAQDVIPKSTAEIITNNVRSDLTAGRYSKASVQVFNQVLAKINGQKIAEPMRYLSAVSIGIMGGLLLVLFLTLSTRNRTNPVYSREAVAATVISTVSVAGIALAQQGEPSVRRVYSPQQSDSSSSCSSCGGSSCGSSCSSGSSCGSCGGGTSF